MIGSRARLMIFARSRRGTAAAAALFSLLGAGVAAAFVTASGVAFLLVAVVAMALLALAVTVLSEVQFAVAVLMASLAATYGIVVHRSPGVTLLEVLLVAPASWFALTGTRSLLALEPPVGRLFRLFVAASLGLIVLVALSVVYRPAGGHASTALKELGKDVEIIVLTLGILCWARDRRRFVLAYGFAAEVFFADLLSTVAPHRGHVVHLSSLQTSTPLYLLVLLLPFSRSPRVLPLLGFSAVMLVVAKTREAWLGVLLVVLVILVSPPLRAWFGRGAAAVMGLGATALILLVVAVPALRVRVDRVFSGRDQSVHDRFAMTHAAQLELQHHLLTGVGPGEFKPWLLVHPPPFAFLVGLHNLARDPHNTFAKFAAELGVPGLLLFLCWVAAIVGVAVVCVSDGFAAPRLQPWVVGLVLYAVVYVLMLATTEWGAITRFELPLGAALLLSLGRVVQATRGRSTADPLPE
jgi:hypothetical protein